MESGFIQSIVFSPTGSSRAVTHAVCRGMTGTEISTDLTRQAPEPITFSKKDRVVVSMPVYSGRLPRIAVERFHGLEGNGASVVALVVYGNRAYEDALAELCDRCITQGFKVVSAAAFIGQHSFSSAAHPIAPGRPDRKDLDLAEAFGEKIKTVLENGAGLDRATVPGNRPYKTSLPPAAAATETDSETCSQCGTCATLCPTQAIDMVDGLPQTWQDECIWCMACVQSCPTGARKIVGSKIQESAQRLHTHFSTRREPEIFLPPQK